MPALIGRLLVPAALIVISLASVAIDGFRFGLGNNALQVPILQRAVNPALFPGDPFVDTLGRYTSAVWWILGQVGRGLAIQDWEPIIFVLHVLSRVLFLAGFYSLISLYVRDRRYVVAAVAILGLGWALRGSSIVGGHGLIGRVPDHTGFANVAALFALAAALRGRHVAAAVLAALAFDINAFVGVWLAPVVLVTLLASPSGRAVTRRTWLGAAVAYAFVAGPVAVWVLTTISAPAPAGFQPFDYPAFLREYFPRHFFIDSAPRRDLVELGTIVLSATIALAGLGPVARGLRVCYGAWSLLFLLGAAAPQLTNSPSILNLHLLRIDGFLMMLAAAAAAALAGSAYERRDASPAALAAAVGILAGLATGYWWLTLAAVIAAVAALARLRRALRWLVVSMLAVSGAAGFILFEPFAGPRGWVIASTLVLASVFVLARTPAALGLALMAIFSWTQQTKGLALAALAVFAASAPLPDGLAGVLRPQLLSRALSAGTAVLGLTRATAPEHRLLLGLALAAVVVEAVLARAGARLVGGARARTGLRYAGLALMIAVGTTMELARLGPKDPLVAEIAAWREVQEWAKENTRIDDVFVVPFFWPNGFGVWSERSIWVDWKHGAAVMWAPAYHRVYQERQRAQLEARSPMAFARATGVCYAVVNRFSPWETLGKVNVLTAGLPVLFDNGRFAVIGLCRDRAQ